MEQITKPITAVPLVVQRVLDAITEDNWHALGGGVTRLCLLNRADDMGFNPWNLEGGDPVWLDLHARITARYGFVDVGEDCPAAQLNDTCETAAELKSKVAALYTEAA